MNLFMNSVPMPLTSKRSDTFIIADPSVIGQSHLLINAGFIALVSALYEKIVVLAEKTHTEALSQYLSREKSVLNVRFVPYHNKKNLLKHVSELMEETGGNAVLFLNMYYTLFVRLNIRYWASGNMHFYWVLHSHLTSLARKSWAARVKNTLKLALLFNLFRRNSFIVCSDAIKRNFMKHSQNPRYGARIFSVFHPIGISLPFPDPAEEGANSVRPVSIIFIQGWHALSPSIEAGLARLEKTAAAKETITLTIVRNSFNESANGKAFSRDYLERLTQITHSDFFLHLPGDPYALQASGAIIDMVVARMPVIGLRTEFATELEAKIGEFGFFFDSMEALCQCIEDTGKDILNAKKAQFKKNLSRGARILKELSAHELSLAGPEFKPLLQQAGSYEQH